MWLFIWLFDEGQCGLLRITFPIDPGRCDTLQTQDILLIMYYVLLWVGNK